MVPDDVHDFFVASAGVAGALIGLLFVAVSVVGERLASRDDGPLARVRAAAALTAFTNALVVSLFALVPGDLGDTALSVAIVGLVFVAGALLSLRHLRTLSWGIVRDLVFLVGLTAIFVDQLIQGLRINGGTHARGGVTTLATLVAICFLVGVARAWELIGGPTIGLAGEATDLGRAALQRRAGPHDDR
ncbi:hypothetical protein [Jatrophihabitans endophyticus]|uniref:hypothetical protein n=1 Tax=Jatrophihabitans endophyticus TaxID=1206085 RepID=UPI0019DDBA1C|nr:hypothetical protein [Jatrophihabitans endophyticus]MBE7190289.1 hypothetical protein [Jatrophihabitans endophyticus]